ANELYRPWPGRAASAQAGTSPDDEAVRRAVSWLLARQNPDGGWGESNDSYALKQTAARKALSTPHQTAWALLGLMAVGEASSVAVRSGIEYLLRTQRADGLWTDPHFTAPGFPRVFYLKYHGYCAYFPLWALSAFRNLVRPGAAHWH